MDKLVRAGGEGCATDQILCNVTERAAEVAGAEARPAPYPVMACSPVGEGRLPTSPTLTAKAKRYEATPFQVALARALRDPNVIAIPKASGGHV